MAVPSESSAACTIGAVSACALKRAKDVEATVRPDARRLHAPRPRVGQRAATGLAARRRATTWLKDAHEPLGVARVDPADLAVVDFVRDGEREGPEGCVGDVDHLQPPAHRCGQYKNFKGKCSSRRS